jgi:hypothetical protein
MRPTRNPRKQKQHAARERGLGVDETDEAGRWLAGKRGGVPVWVNKRSGVAHCRRDCETILSVPDGALRQVVVKDGLPRFRKCSFCSGV